MSISSIILEKATFLHIDRSDLCAFLHRDGIERFWNGSEASRNSPYHLLEGLARLTGFTPLYPSDGIVRDVEKLALLPPGFSRQHRVVPITLEHGQSLMAVDTPFLGTLPMELERFLGVSLEYCLTQPQFLETLLAEDVQEVAELNSYLSGLDKNDDWLEGGESEEDLKDQARAAPIIQLVNRLFTDAIARRASDIHIDPGEEGVDFRFRIDGILQPVSTTPRRFQAAIVSRLKIIADLDISERRLPQDGRISLKVEGRGYDIRVATVPTVHGEGVVLRILDRSGVQVGLSEIGFEKNILEQWQELIGGTHGVILVTGPTGSGKTTTLYATLNHMKSPGVKVITVEDPVEYRLPGIKQIQVDVKVGMTFAGVLRSMLRLDPDIIMVGEVRDGETAGIAVQASLTGHQVLTTLHTNDAPTAITRLVEMGIEPYLVAASLEGVLAQRLVRRLCLKCRWQNEDGSWRAVGCEACSGGYSGRLGIYELMPVTEVLRELITNGADASRIRNLAREQGMATLWEDGMKKAGRGETTIEEVRRVAG